MNRYQQTRIVFIITGLTDAFLGAAALSIYFGVLPVDVSAWGVPRWAFGAAGALLFFSGVGVVAYQMTRTDVSE